MAPAAINNEIPPSIGIQGGGQQPGPPGGGGGPAKQHVVKQIMKIINNRNFVFIGKLLGVNI